MCILLTVVAVSFKSWCMHGFGFAFMFLMALLGSLMIVSHVLKLDILICILSPTYISSMSFLTTKMKSGFGVLTFFILVFSNHSLILMYHCWILEISIVSQST